MGSRALDTPTPLQDPLTPAMIISNISLCGQHGSPSTGNVGSKKERGPLIGLGPLVSPNLGGTPQAS